MENGSSPIVNVCSGGRKALKDPQFLIEHEGKLYLTVAVLEFDPKYPDLSPDQKRDIEELRSSLKGESLPGLVTPPETRMRIFGQTNPPNDD